jgi:hypothetical protein
VLSSVVISSVVVMKSVDGSDIVIVAGACVVEVVKVEVLVVFTVIVASVSVVIVGVALGILEVGVLVEVTTFVVFGFAVVGALDVITFVALVVVLDGVGDGLAVVVAETLVVLGRFVVGG